MEGIVSESKPRQELALLAEALDAIPDEGEGRDAVQRLGIDLKSWAADIRGRVAAAIAEERRRRFASAAAAYQGDLERYARRPAEPTRSRDHQQRYLREIMARVPAGQAASIQFHKFEKTTDEEIAEMIRAVRHLLGENDE
jgi:DNA-directed RNA polymerase specialized sigma24 family protein